MKRVPLFIFIFLLILIISGQVLNQYGLTNQKEQRNQINLATQQQVLSQAIALEAYKIVYRGEGSQNIKSLFQEWKSAQERLLEGNSQGRIPKDQASKIQKQLLESNSKIRFIGVILEKESPDFADLLGDIEQNQANFSAKMDQLISLLEEVIEQDLVWAVRWIFIFNFLLMLGLILGGYYIYIYLNKQWAKESQESERVRYILEAVSNSYNSAITYIDRNYTIQYSNHAAKAICKLVFGKEEQVGDHALDFVLPELREESIQYYERVLKGEVVQYEKTDGERWWEFSLYPIVGKNGEVEGFSHNCKEITEEVNTRNERNLLSERLNIIAENFPNGSVTLIDLDLQILYTNGSDYAKSGIDPQQWYGKPLSDFLSSEIWKKFELEIPKVEKGEMGSYESNYGGRYYLTRLKPIKMEGEVKKILITSVDVTELYNSQKLLLDKNKRLENISWFQSHEVRRPLANILGLVQVIMMSIELGEPVDPDTLQGLNQSSQELDGIIHKIVKEAEKK